MKTLITGQRIEGSEKKPKLDLPAKVSKAGVERMARKDGNETYDTGFEGRKTG